MWAYSQGFDVLSKLSIGESIWNGDLFFFHCWMVHQVSVLLNGMMDHSFRERSVRKTQGQQLVKEVLRRWDSLQSWWEGQSCTPESKTATLLLLSKLLQVIKFKCLYLQFSAYISVDLIWGTVKKNIMIDIFPLLSDRLLCLLRYQPRSLQTGVFHFHHATGRHESATESQGNGTVSVVDEFKRHNLYFSCLSCLLKWPSEVAGSSHPCRVRHCWCCPSSPLSQRSHWRSFREPLTPW